MRLIALGTTLLTCLSLSLSALAAERSVIEVKSDSLRFLQDLRSENVKRLKEIDQTLSRKIEEATSATLETEVGSLRSAKREHTLRQEFLDRLIFQIDTKFAGGDLRAFLERSLTDMAKVDAVSSANETGLWKFMKYAADAVRRLPEKKENVLAFLEGYMTKSVSNPLRPEDYLSARNYTNGSKSEEGSPLSREDVGAIADRRLQELNETQAPQKSRVGGQQAPAVTETLR
ncbi:MAG: hypothetical protein KF799_06540 [Bdellovibrionales bacterium]|nr:hypothetical protein [Bdellovibrionales bacterium]